MPPGGSTDNNKCEDVVTVNVWVGVWQFCLMFVDVRVTVWRQSHKLNIRGHWSTGMMHVLFAQKHTLDLVINFDYGKFNCHIQALSVSGRGNPSTWL